MILLLRVKLVAVAKLEETQVGVFAVHIIRQTLQTAEKQCLPHHVEVAAEGVHDLHQVVDGIVVEVIVVGGLGQRVVHNLVESAAHQLLCHQIVQLVLTVFVALDYQ